MKAIYGAVFTQNDSVIILYGEGFDLSSPLGYYRYLRESSLLQFLFAEPMGFHGFDVTSDGNALIYPRAPRYLVRNLGTGQIDTGQVYAEWLKLSPDESRIAFSTNSLNLYRRSQIGIIERSSGQISWLNIQLADTTNYGATFATHPIWSTDSRLIFFSGVPLATSYVPGPLGPTNIYFCRIQ